MKPTVPRARMKFLIAGMMVAIILAMILLETVSYVIECPPRRELKKYHREWMEQSNDHGINVRHFKCLSDQVPVIVVLPNAKTGPAKRGVLIRSQLASRGTPYPEFGETVGSIVLLHGRKGRKEDMLPIAERFCAVGFRCVLIDLPANGENPEKRLDYASRSSENLKLDQILIEIDETTDYEKTNYCIMGVSLGGAYAMKALSENSDRWTAAAIISSFDSLEYVIENRLRKYLGIFATPVCKLATVRSASLITKAEPAQWAKSVTCPTLVIHGDQDEHIPIEIGKRLYEAIKTQDKKFVVVTNANHNNIFITPMQLYAEIAEWFLSHY